MPNYIMIHNSQFHMLWCKPRRNCLWRFFTPEHSKFYFGILSTFKPKTCVGSQENAYPMRNNAKTRALFKCPNSIAVPFNKPSHTDACRQPLAESMAYRLPAYSEILCILVTMKSPEEWQNTSKIAFSFFFKLPFSSLTLVTPLWSVSSKSSETSLEKFWQQC